ncbi:MAG: hypothetical protein HY686_06065 [Chloroflexi bacterium]|nr:hypothetical protein [Chloroflexota bacterium]
MGKVEVDLGQGEFHLLLAGAVSRFYYLRLALSAVLAFVGAKMVLSDVYEVPITASLLVIAVLLAVAIPASWLRARRLAPKPARVEQ